MGVDFIYPSHINLPNSNFHELILSWFESLVKVIWFTIIALKRLPFLMNWNFCYTFCKHISGQQLEYKLQFLNRKVMMLGDILNFCNAWWKGKAYLKLDQTMPIFSKLQEIHWFVEIVLKIWSQWLPRIRSILKTKTLGFWNSEFFGSFDLRRWNSIECFV